MTCWKWCGGRGRVGNDGCGNEEVSEASHVSFARGEQAGHCADLYTYTDDGIIMKYFSCPVVWLVGLPGPSLH